MKPPRREFLKQVFTAAGGLSLPLAAQVPPARTAGNEQKVFPHPAFFSGREDLPEDLFGDVALMRKGGPSMTMGSGPTSIAPITSRQEWAVKATALRQIFQLMLGTAPLNNTPLSIRLEGEKDRGEIVERRVSYLLSPGERVTSLLLLPKKRARPLPALLTIHPTAAEGKEQTVGRGESANGQLTPAAARRAYGWELAQRGFITFSPDLLGAGERAYPGRRSFDNQPFIDAHPHWSGTGKDLHDLQRALDVMQTMPEIDPTRIGSIGHSQGAGLTCYLAAVDDRIRVGVANCGVWPSRLRENPFHLARTGWWTGQPNLRPFCAAGKPLPIDSHELLALAAPRPFLNIVALNDCGFGPEDETLTRPAWENLALNVRKIYALHDAAADFQNVVHLDGHDFHDPMRTHAYQFLEQKLLSQG